MSVHLSTNLSLSLTPKGSWNDSHCAQYVDSFSMNVGMSDQIERAATVEGSTGVEGAKKSPERLIQLEGAGKIVASVDRWIVTHLAVVHGRGHDDLLFALH